jgi:hypothetical protein
MGALFLFGRIFPLICCTIAITSYKIEVCSPTTRQHISAALFCTHILAAIVRVLNPIDRFKLITAFEGISLGRQEDH